MVHKLQTRLTDPNLNDEVLGNEEFIIEEPGILNELVRDFIEHSQEIQQLKEKFFEHSSKIAVGETRNRPLEKKRRNSA